MGTIIRRSPRPAPREFSGEFAVAGGTITGGSVKFMNEVTVTRISAGLYEFTIVDGKQGRLSDVDAWVIGLTTSTDGGWSITLSTDTVSTTGKFRLQFRQQSFAAADVVGTVKVWFETEGAAA